jgi:hypothetical protein
MDIDHARMELARQDEEATRIAHSAVRTFGPNLLLLLSRLRTARAVLSVWSRSSVRAHERGWARRDRLWRRLIGSLQRRTAIVSHSQQQEH